MTPTLAPQTTATPAPRTACTYQGCRINVRAFLLYGHLRRYRYTLKPGKQRPMWLEFRCTTPFPSAEVAMLAGKTAIDERLWHEAHSGLDRDRSKAEGGTIK